MNETRRMPRSLSRPLRWLIQNSLCNGKHSYTPNNLALDAVWRFAGMPEDFYRD